MDHKLSFYGIQNYNREPLVEVEPYYYDWP